MNRYEEITALYAWEEWESVDDNLYFLHLSEYIPVAGMERYHGENGTTYTGHFMVYLADEQKHIVNRDEVLYTQVAEEPDMQPDEEIDLLWQHVANAEQDYLEALENINYRDEALMGHLQDMTERRNRALIELGVFIHQHREWRIELSPPAQETNFAPPDEMNDIPF